MSGNGYTYKDPPKIPKGHWRSVYGGFERTPLAGFVTGTHGATDIKRDQSPAARRKRTRERIALNAKCEAYEREIAQALAEIDAEETRALKEFHNG